MRGSSERVKTGKEKAGGKKIVKKKYKKLSLVRKFCDFSPLEKNG
jgi:hypothetical protein